MVVATRRDATAPSNSRMSSSTSTATTTAANHNSDPITVGRTVEVARRTWPGINKQGGVARVVDVHMVDGIPSSVSVHYIIGGKERNVPIQYVQLAPQYEQAPSTSSLRDRNRLLGRCTRCGSLRTDCGSCDWAIEEEVTSSSTKPKQRTQKSTVSSSAKLQSSSSSRSKRREGSKRNLLEFSSSSEDDDSEENDSDDDDLALRQLVAKNKSRYQSYKRMKQRRNQLQFSDSSSSSEDENQERIHMSKSKRDGSGQRQNGKPKPKRSRQEQEFWAGLSDSSSDSEEERIFSPKRKTIRKLSLLPLSVSRNGRRRHKKSKSFAENTASASMRPVNEASQSPSRNDHHSSPELRASASLEHQNVMNVDEDPNIGEVDSPVSQPLADWSPQSETVHTPPSCHEQSQRPDTPERYGYDPSEAARGNDRNDSSTLALSQFIQPEGEAETLPEEMLDQTARLEYTELPTFLQELTTRMQDDLLPDAELSVARLERESKQVPQNDKVFQTKCRQTWLDLRDSLVRNGVDQWIIALRRLENHTEYRRVKHQLSARQRRQRRQVLELQELQFDALEEKVEQVMQKLKYLLRSLDSYAQSSSEEDMNAQSDSNSSSDESDMNENYETQDLVPLNELAHSPSTNVDLTRPFDPHQHAQRARSTKQASNPRKINSSNKRSSRTSRKRRKAAKRSKNFSDDLASFIVDDLTQTRRSKKKPRQENVDKASMFVDDEANSRSRTLSLSSSQNDQEDNHRHSRPRKKPSQRRRHDASSADQHSEEGDFGGPPIESPQGDKSNENIPPTFNLFAPLYSVPQNRPVSTRDLFQSDRRRSRLDRAPIMDRMQQFLDANADNTLDHSGPSSSDDLFRTVAEKVGHQSSSSGNQSVPTKRNRPSPEIEAPCETNNSSATVLAAEQILALDSQLRAQSHNEHFPPCEATMSDLCSRLKLCFGGDPNEFSRVVRDIRSKLSNVPMDPTSGVNEFLGTALELLDNYGPRTLLEMISMNDVRFSVHIKLLGACVHVLELGLEVTLRPSDGLAFDIFSKGRHSFLKYLTLQIVECISALVNPGPWKLQIRDTRQLFSQLWSLKEAIGKMALMSEMSCLCLLQDLGCQQWTISETKDSSFLSSLSRDDWRSFLSSAKYPESPTSSRFASLGKVLPRSEIDAHWTILAFFSSPTENEGEKGMARWQIISKLLSSGVLSGQVDGSTCEIPPDPSQLSACTRELALLSTIVANGSLSPLPGSDSILVNLIRRSIQLQVDDLSFNPNSAARLYRTLKVSKGTKKRIDHVFNASSHVRLCDPVKIVEVLQQGVLKQHQHAHDALKVRDSILPSAGILTACLELCAAWIRKLPNKKARQARFSKSIQSLVKDLTEKSAKQRTGSSSEQQQQPLSFESAYASVSTNGRCNDDVNAARAFLMESASFLRLYPSICASVFASSGMVMPSVVDITIVDSIWDSISPQELKARQQKMLGGTVADERFSAPHMDPFSLYIVGKTMTFIAFLQLDVDPWSLSDGNEVCRVTQCELSPPPMFHQHLEFLLTSIFTCIDCLCDQTQDSFVVEILSKLFRNAALLFTHLSAILSSRQSKLHASIQKLGKVIVSKTGLTIRSCYVRITSRDEMFENDAILIQAFFAMLRANLAFRDASSIMDCEASDNSPTGSGYSSNIGSSGIVQSTQAISEAQALSTLIKCLVVSLKKSKPSEHFTMSRVSSNSASVNLESFEPGRLWKPILAKNVDKLCKCIVAAIVISDDSLTTMVHGFLSDAFKPSCGDDDNGDGAFNRLVASRTISELCALSGFNKRSKEILWIFREEILLASIEMMLDSTRIETLPTCNLDGIKDAAGEEAEQHALTMLDFVHQQGNGGSDHGFGSGPLFGSLDKKVTRGAEEFSAFVKIFGQTFRALGDREGKNSCLSRLGMNFEKEDFDTDGQNIESFDLLCIESEVFRNLRLLRGIVSVLARSPTTMSGNLSFERISAFIILASFSQTLRITQSLQYRNDVLASTGTSDSLQRFRRAKLEELLRCYCDLTLSILSWILRESVEHKSQSNEWKNLALQARDKFLCPVLQNQSGDIISSMSHVMAVAESFIFKSSQRARPMIRGSSQRSRYLGYLLPSAIRRSRNLLLYFAVESKEVRPLSRLIALLASPEAGTVSQDHIALYFRVIGSSFLPSLPQEAMNDVSLSPLSRKIDKYFLAMDGAIPSNAIVSGSLEEAKLFVFKNVVAPRLSHQRTDLNIKLRLLILFIEATRIDRPSLNPPYDESSVDTFVSVGKGINAVVQMALTQGSVEDAIIEQLLVAIRTLSSMQVRTLTERGTVVLLQWARSNCYPSLPTCSSEVVKAMTERQLKASFLLSLFSWVEGLAQIIADGSEMGISRLSVLRDSLRPESKEKYSTQICDEATTWLDTLTHLQVDQRLFPERPVALVNVSNKYAKPQATHEDLKTPLENWRPSGSARRRAKEFMTEMIATS